MKYDWLRDYEDTDLEPMEMGAEERERVLQNALGKLVAETGPGTAGKAVRKKKKRRLPRFFGILAAVLAVGLLTAGATGILDTGGMLYLIFGTQADPEMIGALGMAGYPIGQSQTLGGYTVTMQGVIGDRTSCYLVFDVTAPEGVVLDGANGYGFAAYSMEIDSRWGGSCGYFVGPLPDEDPSDNVVSFMFSYDGDAVLPGKTCNVALRTFIEYVDDQSGDGEWDNEKIIADEEWTFTFRMEYEDVSVKVPIRQPVRFPDSGAELCRIYVSPLSVRLEYRRPVTERLFGGAEEIGWDAERQALEYRPTVVLHFRDGSSFTVGQDAEGQIHGGLSASGGSSGLTRVSASYSFDMPVNTAELVSVDVDGVNFPVR